MAYAPRAFESASFHRAPPRAAPEPSTADPLPKPDYLRDRRADALSFDARRLAAVTA